jgi:hypothetical protein
VDAGRIKQLTTTDAPIIRAPKPGGYKRSDRPARTVVACSVIKGVHRWAQPFQDGDTCACGALRLARSVGHASFEMHDE